MLINVCKNGAEALRVLALAPDTPGLPDLEATADGGELEFMRNELSSIHIDALIGTVSLTGKYSLADALRDGNYAILHLISHGDCDAVQLTPTRTESGIVTWQELSRLLSQHHVNLVLAMTCNSRPFADGLLAAGMPQVICTTGEIANDDARQFAREFYHALVRGMSVTEAVAFAKSRMSADGAAMVLLLPDEEQPVESDPVLVYLKRMEQDHIAWRAEMRNRLTAIENVLSTHDTRQGDLLRSLTQAVVHLMEVLAK